MIFHLHRMPPVHYHSGKFPPQSLQWERLIPYLGPAHAALARYDGLLSAIPNVALLLSPMTTQEAVLSSRIEGTQATMGEVLTYEAEALHGFSPRKEEDIQEILNYRKALRHAMRLLETLPLCQRVLLETHKVLMDSVRGHGKSPGAYRRIPNWIGPPGCTLETARFIPIAAVELPEAMSRFEQYIHIENPPDRLVQLAVLHAEFEALHPFLDGNGRLGRMLIPLFLWQMELIHQPMFYISGYFESNREKYYDRLLAVSAEDGWTEWCQFFLQALRIQATEHADKARQILDLYNRRKNELKERIRSTYMLQALDWIFQRPIFRGSDLAEETEITSQTARRMLAVFREAGLLTTLVEGSGRRPAVYVFAELVNITEGRPVF